MNQITILHVFKDDKFFDLTKPFFDSIKCVKNNYVYYTKKKNYKFRYIKDTEDIEIISDFKEYIKLLSSSDIDVIYFQSLPVYYYKFFKYIDSKKKIIWWCWGYDIYDSFSFYHPIIPVKLYTPLTHRYLKCSVSKCITKFIKKLLLAFLHPCFLYRRKIAIKRIDYFSPVLEIEYDMMKKEVPYFHATPFMIKGGPGILEEELFYDIQPCGDILIGNSLTATNNHFDIIDLLKYCSLQSTQKLIFPISYGVESKQYLMALKEECSTLPISKIWMESFLPRNEYYEILSNISFAIFGVLRQQAMGNIYLCLARGVKVFLFKDSIPFKYLSKLGYIVFSIDDDLVGTALQIPLTKEQVIHNNSLYNRLNHERVREAQIEFDELVRLICIE